MGHIVPVTNLALESLNALADYLTTNQVARSLGVTRACVCLAVKEGRLEPAAKLPGVNGAYLFDQAAVDAWKGPRLFEYDGHLVFGAPGRSAA